MERWDEDPGREGQCLAWPTSAPEEGDPRPDQEPRAPAWPPSLSPSETLSPTGWGT